jgi:hypothetical protein
MGRQQWAKVSIGRKKSSYIEKDCFEKSQNYCNTGNRTGELNIYLEGSSSTETVRRELHKSTVTGRAAIAKPPITQVFLRCVKDGVTTIKPGHQTTGNAT